jgi:PAS domain S-box-containing protein
VRLRASRLKNTAVVVFGLLLLGLGGYNGYLKATWNMLDDGVFWRQTPSGLVAGRVASGGPGEGAGIAPGDILLAVDTQEVFAPDDVEDVLARGPAGRTAVYHLLRAGERRPLTLQVGPLPRGNLSLYFYLSLVGFFSLIVGTVVMLRRPPDRTTLHFYAICLLFFLTYSISYTGELGALDWALFWIDTVAVLFLPVVFLHFCLSFPERRTAARRRFVVPVLYGLGLALLGAAGAVPWLFRRGFESQAVWLLGGLIDRGKPFYFGALFAAAFLVLLDSYKKTRSLTARRQMKWLVLGTGTGVLPFFAFYAIPFALGQEPRLALELAGYVPLALLPLCLAYAVVKHRLMDVELIFRRTIAFILATAAIVGICLLAVSLFEVAVADGDEPHVTLIAVVCSVLVITLFTPVKARVQEGIDRLFYRERYTWRKTLLRLSQELNGDLELDRLAETLLKGIHGALGVSTLAVFLREGEGDFTVFRSLGFGADVQASLPARGSLVQLLQAEGQPLNAEASSEDLPEAGPLNLTHYFPCRVKGELIAVLGVGRKEGLDPLNSEEVDLLQALAGQAATAFVNGRLYQSLRAQASELQHLTEYNENILESLDSGILVLDLDGRVVRWNRALEALYGRRREEVLGKALDEIFPESFLEALRGSLVLGESEDIASIYKLHLPTADHRSLMINVSIGPFEFGSGERRGTVLILNDITARVRLEEQLQHADKMASIGLLAAGVAHEVNTPLAGISSYTQMLRDQVGAGDGQADLLVKIEKQTFRAAKIVNNLLNFARSGTAEMEPLDLNKVLSDVVSLVEHQLDKARIKVRRDFAPRLPTVRGNESRLQQVFFNLVLNARDAMPRGGWLTLVTRAEDDAAVVEVADTGEGIRREHIKRIYDPFFTTKGIGRGTGLGLSVSYGILQEHGGAIFVESTPGQGTTFQVALPAMRAAAAAER